MKHKKEPSSINPNRRKFLRATGLGLAATASTGLMSSNAQAERIRSNAHIVIVGAGAAGLDTANRLARDIEGVRITIIDARTEHIYQPGLTLVATGIWNPTKVMDSNARYMPEGVDWIPARVSEFDPETNSLLTDNGQRIPYDYLVVTTGLQVNYDAIEGMSKDLIGQMGIGCVYDNPNHAEKTWNMINAFTDTGGVGLFTRPPGPVKCAGAPLKVTMLTEDLFDRKGTRATADLFYTPPAKGLFSQPDINEFLKEELPSRGITLLWDHPLKGIEPELKRATFQTPEGAQTLDYDFIHVVPPMQAPEPLAQSALAWQSGPFSAGHWMEVDKHTMQHPRFANVFGSGDCVGTPIGKTAASVKAQVPVAVANLVSLIGDREMTARYTGYTSCPLITRKGQGLLVEFDYDLKMVPSFPFINPYEKHWFPWMLKDRMLHPAYNAMLRGRV